MHPGPTVSVFVTQCFLVSLHRTILVYPFFSYSTPGGFKPKYVTDAGCVFEAKVASKHCVCEVVTSCFLVSLHRITCHSGVVETKVASKITQMHVEATIPFLLSTTLQLPVSKYHTYGSRCIGIVLSIKPVHLKFAIFTFTMEEI